MNIADAGVGAGSSSRIASAHVKNPEYLGWTPCAIDFNADCSTCACRITGYMIVDGIPESVLPIGAPGTGAIICRVVLN